MNREALKYQPGQRSFFGELTPFRYSLIDNTLVLLPDIVRKSNHWQTRPEGPVIVFSLDDNAGVLIDPLTFTIISGYFNDLKVPNMKKNVFGGAVFVTDGHINHEDYSLHRKLEVVSGYLLKHKTREDDNVGVLLMLERADGIPEKMELQRRQKFLNDVGFVETNFRTVPVYGESGETGNLLLWDSRYKKIPRSPSEEVQKVTLEKIIVDLNRLYSPFGYSVINSEQVAEKFLTNKGNYWIKQQLIRGGRGIILGSTCGCRFEPYSGEWTPCGLHENSETEVPPIFSGEQLSQSRSNRPLTAFLDTYDAKPALHKNNQIISRKCWCGEFLEAVVTVPKVTSEGYKLLVNIQCPHDGLHEIEELLADGPDLSHLVPKRVLRHEFQPQSLIK